MTTMNHRNKTVRYLQAEDAVWCTVSDSNYYAGSHGAIKIILSFILDVPFEMSLETA